MTKAANRAAFFVSVCGRHASAPPRRGARRATKLVGIANTGPPYPVPYPLLSPISAMNLTSLGWNDFFDRHFQPYHAAGFMPARIAIEHKNAYDLVGSVGEFAAVCTGRLRHEATTRAALPAVGDWVAIRPRDQHSPAANAEGRFADIHAVLPRQTKFSRRAAGADAVEQIVAANIDTVFLVTALDHNF